MAPDRFFARLGALLTAPKQLARRDLVRDDGKGVDDLVLLTVLVLVANGAARLVGAAGALAAGRFHSVLRRLVEVLEPTGPIIALWVVLALAFAVFASRVGRRRIGELAARVVAGFVIANVVVTAIAAHLDAGSARYALTSIPWATTALLFGLVLREAIEPLTDAPTPAFAPGARYLGVFVVALVGLTGVYHALDAGDAGASVTYARKGQPAPPIDLPLIDGKRLQLDSLRGRRVVLTFWASWCGPCMEELPELERAYRARAADGPLVYAINVDEPTTQREALVRGIVARLGLTFPVALDDGQAGHAYKVTRIPTLARVDGDGRFLGVAERPLDEAELRDALR